jgi:N-methylhydantoinase B
MAEDATSSRPSDPVTEEIIRAGLVAITDEMKTNLMRTAYNLIIYEAQDFTVGLFDAEGNTVSIGLGLPMFIRGLSNAIKAKLAFYGEGGIEPGDILLTNDAYISGSHLNHMIFTLPIFWEGEIVAFASSMAHWVDIGGVLGGTTRDIYSEGLQLPIVKIFKRGVQDDELTRLIEMNVRFPRRAMGDLRAQIAAIRTGEARMLRLLQRYGKQAVTGSIADMFDRSETLARQAVSRIPDGDYAAQTSMDDDGVNVGTPVPIKVKVSVRGDHMTIDLSEVSPQVAGYFNSGATAGRSAAEVAFKCLTSPQLFPINDGSFRPVDVVLPPGRVVSATKPAAMRWWMTYPMTVVDCVFRALSGVMPDGGIAGHHADLLAVQAYGVDSRTGRFFQYFGGPQGGGWGATGRGDGVSATICINDGDTHNTPVEAVETKYPVTVERFGLRVDSAGAGRHRGGLGVELAVRMETDTRINSFIERTTRPPWGLEGGHAGRPNEIRVRHASEEVGFANGKLDSHPLRAGDGYIVRSAGGGGHGDPTARPVESVLSDVRAGYVSVQAARDTYGVVVVGEPLWAARVDEDATGRLRRQG